MKDEELALVILPNGALGTLVAELYTLLGERGGLFIVRGPLRAEIHRLVGAGQMRADFVAALAPKPDA